MVREKVFQERLIRDLKTRFEGCIILKNDPNYLQGIPDLIVLHGSKWAALECKCSADAHRQANQEYYVDILNRMSFAKFIYPDNKEEILHELEQTFSA